MKLMSRTLTTIVAAAAFGACAPMSEQAGPETGFNTRTRVVVENQNWLDMNIYVVRDGSAQRLGTVTSMTTANLRLPDAYVLGVSDVQLAARPIGSNEQFVSANIQVFPGSDIKLQLQNALHMSYYSVVQRGAR